ncbi:YraN family protein [Achromobacter dolens]|uniref:YraN family protein n=1 Tax=Achromobacter dolens TaxID=1287738 RepID=UPI000B244E7E|nr:YraN family protein [Achromobacter dolens]
MPDDTFAFELALAARRRAQKRRRRAGTRATADHHHRPAPRRSPRQRIGDGHEDAALRLLRAAGLVLLARKLGCRAGEIDLVMRDGDVLVFVEVRSRQSDAYGGAAASIGRDKQARLARAAAHWLPTLAQRHWQGAVPPARFDAVLFDGDQVRWLRAAFELA